MNLTNYKAPSKYMDTLLVIDDHALFAQSLSHLLSNSLKSVKVHDFQNIEGAIKWVQGNATPTLVVLDIHMGTESGLLFLRKIKHMDFPPPVLIISSDNDPRKISTYVDNGASGFVSKNEDVSILIHAVNSIINNGIYFSDDTRQRLKEFRLSHSLCKNTLSEQHKRILWHLQQGLGNKEIGRRLNISEHTIKYHLSNLYRHLGAKNRTECLMQANKQGLL